MNPTRVPSAYERDGGESTRCQKLGPTRGGPVGVPAPRPSRTPCTSFTKFPGRVNASKKIPLLLPKALLNFLCYLMSNRRSLRVANPCAEGDPPACIACGYRRGCWHA